MMATEDDRATRDSDKYSSVEREAHREMLSEVDDAKDLFLLEVAAAARKYGQCIEAINPMFVLWDGKERGHEAIQGFVEHAQAVCADLAGDLKDHEEIAKSESIVEVGYDG